MVCLKLHESLLSGAPEISQYFSRTAPSRETAIVQAGHQCSGPVPLNPGLGAAGTFIDYESCLD